MAGRIIAYKALRDDGGSYWADQFPVSLLKQWWLEIGPISFASQYQASPINTKGNYLQKEWLHYYHFEERHDLELEKVIIFIDPAISQKGSADYFALAVAGRSINRVYLLDLIKTRAPLESQLEIIKDKWAMWTPSEVCIEAGGAQLYLVEIVKANTLFNVTIPSKQWHASDKKSKFEVCAAHFNASRALLPGYMGDLGEWVPIPEFEPFLSEWVDFPVGPHDDTLDAVSGAISVLVDGTSPAGISEPDNIEDASEFVSQVMSRDHERDLTDEERAIIEEYFSDSSIRRVGFFRNDASPVITMSPWGRL